MQVLPRLRCLLAPLVALAALLAGSCAHSYHVEDRDTPVHVWLAAPDLAADGGVLDARITVGGHVVVEGPVTFQAGHATVALPSLRLRTGAVTVTAALEGGALRATQQVGVGAESWIRVLVRGRTVSIAAYEDQPSSVPR